MTIAAAIVCIHTNGILVKELCGGEELMVHTRAARRFRVGECVRITYNGRRTHSIPPQITASSIRRIRCPGSPGSTPSVMTAIVLQPERGFFIAWDTRERRLVHVEFSGALQLRSGRHVTIEYDRITLDNPPRIFAVRIY